MKLPRQTDVVALPSRAADKNAPTPMMGQGIQPSINIGCILTTAAGCFLQCGTDVSCLLACSPALAKCL
jgi:hypothetical protein